MDLIKAILNQILLFFDDTLAKFKRLPAKGRRRLLLILAVALLLLLLLILGLSSCRSSGEAMTAEAMTEGVRTRVRGSVSAEGTEIYGEASIPSIADPASDEPDQGTEDGEDEPLAAAGDQPTAPETSDAPQTGATAAPGQTYPSLKKHDKSSAVTTLQNRLMALGYLDIDEPTDYFGSITETAVILFQRQHDLKQDGIAGNETQTILFSDQAQRYCLKEGFEGEDVEALQEQLVDLGYMDSKEVDRIYGPITVAAVQAFQRRNGLHVDGLAGAKTLELLYSDDAKPSRDKKATATPKPTSKATSKTTPKKNNGKKTATPKPTKKATATPKKDTRIDKFISVANSKLGCEYKLGAKGPDKFDCSGFVYYCLRQAGVSCTRLNALGFSRKSGWKLIDSLGSIKRGDILFFRSDTESSVNHTGIYIGSGTMIDASSGNGKVVKRAISPYFKRNFVCARRPWNE